MSRGDETAPWTERLRFPLALLLCVAVGAALRFSRLGLESFWNDEIFTVWIVRQPFAAMWRSILADVHPPLYYLVLRAWVALFGSGDVAVRACSAALGVVTIPIAGLGFARLYGTRAGALTAAIMAAAPPLVHYSQEARMYALVVLAMTLAVIGALSWQRCRSRNWGCLYVLGVAAAGWSQYYAMLGWACLAAGFAAYLVLSGAKRDMLRSWLAWNLAPAALFLAWSPVFYAQSARTVGGLWLIRMGPPSPGALAEMVTQLGGVYFADGAFHISGGSVPLAFRAGITLALITVAALLLPPPPEATDKVFQTRTGELAILAAAGLAPLAMVWGMSQFRNVWLFRGLLFTLPALIGLLAVGLAQLRGRRWLPSLAGALLAGGAIGSFANRGNYHREAWRETASFLKAEQRPGDAFLVTAPFTARNLVHYGIEAGAILPVNASLPSPDQQHIRTRLAGSHRAWVVISHAPEAPLEQFFDAEGGWRVTQDLSRTGIRLLCLELASSLADRPDRAGDPARILKR